MPYMRKPLCRNCDSPIPHVTLLMLCVHCKHKIKEQADKEAKR